MARRMPRASGVCGRQRTSRTSISQLMFLVGIKATVHCPRVDKPTWARHWGFAYGTTYEVAKLVSAAQPERHKLSWTGARLAPEVTLEWRVFISGGGLQRTPI